MSTLRERLKELTEKSSKFIHVGKYTCKLQYQLRGIYHHVWMRYSWHVQHASCTSSTSSIHDGIIWLPCAECFYSFSHIIFTERFYLVFWPEENTYSMVPESKIIGEKEPPAGQMVKIKEGQKAYSGKVIAVGKKLT